MQTTNRTLTGKQKAAILLIALGPEVSVHAFKHLNEREIDQLTVEIVNTRQVSPNQKEEVLEEFYHLITAQKYISEGGYEYAKEILERALGSTRALNIIQRLQSNMKNRPFQFARKAEVNQLLSVLQGEHPQTIALVLSYLESSQASKILSQLPREKQADVARRVALMDSTSPEVVNHVEEILEQKLSTAGNQDLMIGGIDSVVEMLNKVDRSTEKIILEALEANDPELAQSIRERLFVFEDIVHLEDSVIQRIIREVENEDLLVALRVASESIKEGFFRNMSSRRVEAIKEELENMGPIKLRDVEEAQSRIVALIRELEDKGEIDIKSGGEDIVV